MRKICTGLLALALVLGLVAARPAQAKVYKMDPEERAAALKEKKAKRAKARKSGKSAAAGDQSPGGWVEVKPGDKIARKSRKGKVDEIAQAAEQKGKKSKKSKKAEAVDEVKAEKPAKKGKKAEAADEMKAEKPAKKGKKAEALEEKKSAEKPGKKGKKSGKKTVSRGDRVVGSNYSGERKVSASSAEVRRPGGAPAAAPAAAPDDLSGYSVSRPGQEKPAAPAGPAGTPAVAPEVRQEVQPGPLDLAKPVGTEHKGGEGRF